MPLTLNVGLSRKIGEANYGSRGASVNVEMELDTGLATDPEKLQQRIRQLFSMVRSSVVEELNGNGAAQHSNGNGKEPAERNGGSTGAGNGGQHGGAPRPATQSQVKALFAIAKAKGIDLAQFLHAGFGVRKPEALGIKEASEAIDQLKSQ